jgi:hypothetical protein
MQIQSGRTVPLRMYKASQCQYYLGTYLKVNDISAHNPVGLRILLLVLFLFFVLGAEF